MDSSIEDDSYLLEALELLEEIENSEKVKPIVREEPDFEDVKIVQKLKTENQTFINGQRNKNTTKKNENTYRRFCTYLLGRGEKRSPEKLSLELLDQYLSQ